MQPVYAKSNVIFTSSIIYSPCAYSCVYQHHLHLHCFTDSIVKYIITNKHTVGICTWLDWNNVAGELHNVLTVSTSAPHTVVISQSRSASELKLFTLMKQALLPHRIYIRLNWKPRPFPFLG